MISRRDALKLAAAGLLAPAIGLPKPIAAQESSNWPMYRGNATGTGSMPGPGPSLEKPIAVKWRFEIEKHGQTSPVIADGVVYVGGGGGTLFAVDTSTGDERWRFEPTDSWVRTPAIGSGLIFVPANDTFYALDTSSGREVWRFTTGSYSLPTCINDVVYVDASRDGLLALDAGTGAERWRFPTDGWVSVWRSAPTVSNGTVYLCNRDNSLYAIDAESGRERWRFTTEQSVTGSAAVVDETVFICSSGKLFALDTVSGQEKWNTDARSYSDGQRSPVVSNGVVYMNRLAIRAETGEVLTSFPEEWRPGESPVMTSDIIYASGESLSTLNVNDGKELWSYFNGYLNVEPPAIVDETIFVSVDNYSNENFGYLYALGNIDSFRATLVEDVILRGGPSMGGAERGAEPAGTEIDRMDKRTERDGQVWVEVTINGVPGWIPLEAIDPTDLETEYVYIPQ